MPRSVTLKLEYDYRPNLVREVEDPRRVQVSAYLSKDLGHSLCVREVGSHNNTLELDMRIPDVAADGPFISPGAGCTLRFFALGQNDQGTKVMRQVGSAYFSIGELLVAAPTRLSTRYVTFPNLENPRTGTVPQKGTITLTAHPVPGVGKSAIRPANKYDFVPENYPAFEQVLINIQTRAGTIHQELRPTQPNTVGLKMPIWRSAHLIAPGALFATPRSEPASEKWWFDCIVSATRRAYPELTSNAHAISFLNQRSLSESERMNILMLAHTAVVAAGTCYVSDGIFVKPGDHIPVQQAIAGQHGHFARLAEAYPPRIKSTIEVSEPLRLSDQGVQFVGAEDFAAGPLRVHKSRAWGAVGALDCEDGGADICMQARDFMGGNYSNPILLFFKEAADNYDVCQLLKYVNGAELADSLNTNQLGGHMDAGYVSREYENRLREAGSTVHPVLEGFAGRIAVGNAVGNAAPNDYIKNPVITGEGTGLMWPLANDNHAAQLNANWQYLRLNFGNGALRGVRYMMAHAKTQPSRFYNSTLSICPLRVADDYPVIEHVMLQQVPGQRPTICQPYLDFMNGSPKNAARVVGKINEDEIPYMQELLKHHYPVVAYRERLSAPSSQPQLDILCRQIGQLNRREHNSGVGYFQIYFNENDVRPESLATIMSCVQEKTRVCKARYHFENWGDELGTWCLTLHINNPPIASDVALDQLASKFDEAQARHNFNLQWIDDPSIGILDISKLWNLTRNHPVVSIETFKLDYLLDALIWSCNEGTLQESTEENMVTPRQVLSNRNLCPGHWERILKAEVKYPLLVLWPDESPVPTDILDGFHRLAQNALKQRKTTNMIVVSRAEMEQARPDQLASEFDEAQAVLENEDYRREFSTTKTHQIVLMSIRSEDIGVHKETHTGGTQTLRVFSGSGILLLDGQRIMLQPGVVVVIPPGSSHEVRQTGAMPLKLSSTYAPPEHPVGLVQRRNPDIKYGKQ